MTTTTDRDPAYARWAQAIMAECGHQAGGMNDPLTDSLIEQAAPLYATTTDFGDIERVELSSEPPRRKSWIGRIGELIGSALCGR